MMLLLLGLCVLLNIISGIMLIVKAFKESKEWGLISLIPFGLFFFIFNFWEDTKWLARICVISFIGYLIISGLIVNKISGFTH